MNSEHRKKKIAKQDNQFPKSRRSFLICVKRENETKKAPKSVWKLRCVFSWGKAHNLIIEDICRMGDNWTRLANMHVSSCCAMCTRRFLFCLKVHRKWNKAIDLNEHTVLISKIKKEKFREKMLFWKGHWDYLFNLVQTATSLFHFEIKWICMLLFPVPTTNSRRIVGPRLLVTLWSGALIFVHQNIRPSAKSFGGRQPQVNSRDLSHRRHAQRDGPSTHFSKRALWWLARPPLPRFLCLGFEVYHISPDGFLSCEHSKFPVATMSFSKEDETLPIDRTSRVRGSVNMIDVDRIVEWVEVSGRWSRMSVRKTHKDFCSDRLLVPCEIEKSVTDISSYTYFPSP